MQKRVNLEYLQHEELSVDELRNLMGVPKGKLVRVADFNKHALKPALDEVNFLGDYVVEAIPIKRARRLVGFRLAWLKKDSAGLAATWKELDRHRAGRRARMRGAVEAAHPPA